MRSVPRALSALDIKRRVDRAIARSAGELPAPAKPPAPAAKAAKLPTRAKPPKGWGDKRRPVMPEEGSHKAEADALAVVERNRKTIEQLGEQIHQLVDEAQALTRAGEHDASDAKRAKARELAAVQNTIAKGINR